jgi:hypothetical protein
MRPMYRLYTHRAVQARFPSQSWETAGPSHILREHEAEVPLQAIRDTKSAYLCDDGTHGQLPV